MYIYIYQLIKYKVYITTRPKHDGVCLSSQGSPDWRSKVRKPVFLSARVIPDSVALGGPLLNMFDLRTFPNLCERLAGVSTIARACGQGRPERTVGQGK